MQVWKARAAMIWPGVMVVMVVAVAAMFLSEHYGAPVMLFALLLGMALNFLSQEEGGQKNRSAAGIEFTAKQLLRLGVALLGLRITAEQVLALGWQPVAMVVLAVALTIVVGIVLARLMGFQMFSGLLTGGAVAICGASAALALSAAMPNHPRKEQATLFTVIGVGIDAIFVGPYDLSASMGKPGRIKDPEVQAAIGRVRDATLKAGRTLGIYCSDPESARDCLRQGYTLIGMSTDLNYLAQSAGSALAAAKRT